MTKYFIKLNEISKEFDTLEEALKYKGDLVNNGTPESIIEIYRATIDKLHYRSKPSWYYVVLDEYDVFVGESEIFDNREACLAAMSAENKRNMENGISYLYLIQECRLG